MIDITAFYYYIFKITNEVGINRVQQVANIFMFFGALIISISTVAALSALTFVIFLVAHLMWGIVAFATDDKRLLQLNIILISFDIIAIIKRL